MKIRTAFLTHTWLYIYSLFFLAFVMQASSVGLVFVENNNDRDGGRKRRRRIRGNLNMTRKWRDGIRIRRGFLFCLLYSLLGLHYSGKRERGKRGKNFLHSPCSLPIFQFSPIFFSFCKIVVRLSLETTSTSEVKLCEIARCRS